MLKINSIDNSFLNVLAKLMWSETRFQEEEDELDLKNGRILKGEEEGGYL